MMSMKTIAEKTGKLCSSMPCLHADYHLDEKLASKKSGKSVDLMSCRGSFSVPLITLAAIALGGAAIYMICRICCSSPARKEKAKTAEMREECGMRKSV